MLISLFIGAMLSVSQMNKNMFIHERNASSITFFKFYVFTTYICLSDVFFAFSDTEFFGVFFEGGGGGADLAMHKLGICFCLYLAYIEHNTFL